MSPLFIVTLYRARTNHGVPPLKLNKELCKHAQKWADHLASIGKLEHSSNREFGENVAMVSGYKDYSGMLQCIVVVHITDHRDN